MIRIVLGNVGSGKTASTVRWMRDHTDRTIVTNIDVRGKAFSHVIKLKPEMIIRKEVKGYKKDGQEIIELKLNTKFWKELVTKHKSLNVVIDEAHIFFNPRRSMSKLNVIMNDFLALLRRVLGSTDSQGGQLILITQLSRRLDVIAKEMATQVQFCLHHYKMQCQKCHYSFTESNETSNKRENCPACNSTRLKRMQSIIEVYEFKNMDEYMRWIEYNEKRYYNRYFIKDIHTIFSHYNTLQWDDLVSDY